MITVTLKAHHWRIARRDLITLHCNNLVSSIILSGDTQITRDKFSKSQALRPSTDRAHRQRERELWSAAAAKPKKTERERIGKNVREGRNGGGGTYSICNWSEIWFLSSFCWKFYSKRFFLFFVLSSLTHAMGFGIMSECVLYLVLFVAKKTVPFLLLLLLLFFSSTSRSIS